MDDRFNDIGAQPEDRSDSEPTAQQFAQTETGAAPQTGYRTDTQTGYEAGPVVDTTCETVGQAPAKKNRRGLRIAAAALAMVLVGGAAGAAGAGLVFRHGSSVSTEAQTAQTEQTTAAAQQSVSDSSGGDGSALVSETAGSGESSTPGSKVVLPLTNASTTELTPQQVYEKCVNSVVAITNTATTNVFGQASSTASSGSGFIVSADGYIVTNYHVIEGAETIKITLTDGESYDAEVIGYDEDGDIALIKIDALGLTPVSVGNSDTLAVGEMVVAIGNPLGELTNTLTVGYVSALDREIAVDSGTDLNVLQTDCAINPGNSGGPLFDLCGNVIGITTAKYSSSTIEGIGFAIPINDVTAVIGDLTQYGYVTGKPYLGVTLKNLSQDVTTYYGLSGIYVYTVTEDSPAQQAGLKTGDIITAFNGEKITTSTELTSLMKKCSAGDTVTLTILRDGESSELKVTLGDKHEAEAAAAEKQQQEQEQEQEQEQSGSGSWPSGLEDWFKYFYGGYGSGR